MRKVYFVCIGNTCRSPMAAELLNQKLKDSGLDDVRAESFGLSPFYPDSAEVKRLREMAVLQVTGRINGLKEHRPRGIEEIMFREGDRIALLDADSLGDLLSAIERNPSFRGKHVPIMILGIDDPFGGGSEDYLACCSELRRAIDVKFNLLIGEMRI